MNILLILPYYLTWHYSESFNDFLRIWGSFISYLYNLFSIRILISTLFSPWERINDKSAKGADFGEIFGNWIFNGLMRGLGVVIRSISILLGLASILACFVVGLICLAIWILLPAVVIFLFWFGIKALI